MHFQTGDRVQKGDQLAKLSHPDYIKLQEDYLAAQSNLEYSSREYKRQGELAVEKAASLKRMQKAKSTYEQNKAKLTSLETRLRMLHIDPSNIS